MSDSNTPSQRIIAEGSTGETVKDASGRTIELRRVEGRDLSRLMRAAGAAFGENVWTAATMARASVRSIDGKIVPPFSATADGLDGLWDQVDAVAAGAASDWLIRQQEKDEDVSNAGNS